MGGEGDAKFAANAPGRTFGSEGFPIEGTLLLWNFLECVSAWDDFLESYFGDGVCWQGRMAGAIIEKCHQPRCGVGRSTVRRVRLDDA